MVLDSLVTIRLDQLKKMKCKNEKEVREKYKEWRMKERTWFVFFLVDLHRT